MHFISSALRLSPTLVSLLSSQRLEVACRARGGWKEDDKSDVSGRNQGVVRGRPAAISCIRHDPARSLHYMRRQVEERAGFRGPGAGLFLASSKPPTSPPHHTTFLPFLQTHHQTPNGSRFQDGSFRRRSGSPRVHAGCSGQRQRHGSSLHNGRRPLRLRRSSLPAAHLRPGPWLSCACPAAAAVRPASGVRVRSFFSWHVVSGATNLLRLPPPWRPSIPASFSQRVFGLPTPGARREQSFREAPCVAHLAPEFALSVRPTALAVCAATAFRLRPAAPVALRCSSRPAPWPHSFCSCRARRCSYRRPEGH